MASFPLKVGKGKPVSREDHRKYDAALQKMREMEKDTKPEGFLPKDISSWCGAGVMAIILWLLAPKLGRDLTALGLAAMFLLAIYPVKHASNILGGKIAKKRRIWAAGLSSLSLIVTVGLGIFVWPPLPFYKLSSGEEKEFIAAINSQKEPKETLVIKCPASNEAICVVATRYLETFQRAGWKTPTGGVERGVYLKANDGISVSKRPSGGIADPNNPDQGQWVLQSPSIVTLRRAFGQTHMKVTWMAEANLPENVISIYFGPVQEEH